MKVSESISRKVAKIWKNMESIERTGRFKEISSDLNFCLVFFDHFTEGQTETNKLFGKKQVVWISNFETTLEFPFRQISPPDGPVLQIGRIQQDYHRYHSCSIWNIWNMKVIYHVIWTMWQSLSYELYPMDFFCHMYYVVNMMCIIRYIHCIAYTSHIALLM